eukprot:SAG31_NODE_4316_length_3363_cov_11.868862_1_plen_367_part_10
MCAASTQRRLCLTSWIQGDSSVQVVFCFCASTIAGGGADAEVHYACQVPGTTARPQSSTPATSETAPNQSSEEKRKAAKRRVEERRLAKLAKGQPAMEGNTFKPNLTGTAQGTSVQPGSAEERKAEARRRIEERRTKVAALKNTTNEELSEATSTSRAESDPSAKGPSALLASASPSVGSDVNPLESEATMGSDVNPLESEATRREASKKRLLARKQAKMRAKEHGKLADQPVTTVVTAVTSNPECGAEPNSTAHPSNLGDGRLTQLAVELRREAEIETASAAEKNRTFEQELVSERVHREQLEQQLAEATGALRKWENSAVAYKVRGEEQNQVEENVDAPSQVADIRAEIEDDQKRSAMDAKAVVA